MTWTTPRTWIAGEIVTAALMNAQIRDNLLSIVYSPISVEDQTDYLGLAVTSFTAGPNCGSVFTAPDSGKALITVTGHIECNTANESCYLSFEVRSGGTLGSGTVTTAAITDNGVGIGGSGVARTSGSNRLLITGLTGGSSYNARTMHLTTGGTFDIFYRRLLIEAVH